MKKNENMTPMENLVVLLKNDPDKAYDFIANNGHLFSKDELRRVVMEILYGIYLAKSRCDILEVDYVKIHEYASEELADAYNLDFSEEE